MTPPPDEFLRSTIDRAIVTIAAGALAMVLAYTVCGCSGAAFDVAWLALNDDDSGGALDDGGGSTDSGATELETRARVDADDAVDTNTPNEPPPNDGAPVEWRDARSDVTPEVAPVLDTGCALHEHRDPTHGATYRSCLPAGVVGRPETYSSALLAEVVAHAREGSPWPWGKAVDACDGQCTAWPLAVTGGTNWQVWCTGGERAGWYAGALATKPVCPTTDVHGEWW